MITENMVVAVQIATYIDSEVSRLKDKMASLPGKDQYTDLTLVWGTAGQIKALENLKKKLITDEETE